jgi:CspA family cold shock protein
MTDLNNVTGRVKWFNNKSGFGFITACDGDLKDKDIFVHWSAIKVENSQYKYLVQGEYVEFNIVKSEKGEHEYNAVNVSGVKGGNLMCETRRLNREQSRPRPSSDEPAVTQTSKSGSSRPRPRKYITPKPEGNDGFTPVGRKRNTKTRNSSRTPVTATRDN